MTVRIASLQVWGPLHALLFVGHVWHVLSDSTNVHPLSDLLISSLGDQ